MIIVKCILELEYDDSPQGIYSTVEANIGIESLTGADVIAMQSESDTALADYISDDVGYCVQEIIGYSEPDYVIN